VVRAVAQQMTAVGDQRLTLEGSGKRSIQPTPHNPRFPHPKSARLASHPRSSPSQRSSSHHLSPQGSWRPSQTEQLPSAHCLIAVCSTYLYAFGRYLMPSILKVKHRPEFRIWIRFRDLVERGIVLVDDLVDGRHDPCILDSPT